MSVALLSGDKTVEVCDEVEAFTYVIIYYAVRYLNSNVDETTVASFLDKFFDTYDVCNGKYVCGRAKRATIQTGELTVNSDMMLLFHSPMDIVLSELLLWFKSRTIVAKYDARQKKQKSRLSRAPSPTPSKPSTLSSNGVTQELVSFGVPLRRRMLVTDKGPTAEERELADKVVDQTDMINLLSEEIYSSDWELNDKVGDRVPETWHVEHKTRIPAATVTSSKKLKVDTSVPVPATATHSLSGPPPVTPPRRVQTSNGTSAGTGGEF